MKAKKPLIIIPLLVLLAIVMTISSFVTPKRQIVGSWISQTNPNYKIEFFDNGKCKDYYGDKPNKEYTYYISTTCADSTSANEKSLFVQLDEVDGLFSKCYQINGVHNQDQELTITDLDKNEAYSYLRI